MKMKIEKLIKDYLKLVGKRSTMIVMMAETLMAETPIWRELMAKMVSSL